MITPEPRVLWADFIAGYRRLYPLQATHGETLRKIGEVQIRRALKCVTESGERRTPFPGVLRPTTAYNQFIEAPCSSEQIPLEGIFA